MKSALSIHLLLFISFGIVAGCAQTIAQQDEPIPTGDPQLLSNPAESHDGKKQYPANHLAKETSPYLLMHAHNPVQWYPWGEEALAKAKKENKLIFLSVGYSSCYWCHVMERESFMDEKVAEYINEHFVCIKVDREERPDIDNIYMTAVQLMTGRGGWPLSMFLTPDARPIFGGTYFPPVRKGQLPSFTMVLENLQRLWEQQPEQAEMIAKQVTDALQEIAAQQPDHLPQLNADVIEKARTALAEQFDPQHGGFGYSDTDPKQPKFPEPSNLLFLLSQAKEDAKAKQMLLTTLDHMAHGGIYDHLGEGFHRYSTDRFWWVPHFEKMLYDNGQLATVYSQAYQLTGEQRYARVARGIADFVLREMTSPEGGFYAAIDAETDAEEGKFYVWTDDELQTALDTEELALLNDTLVWSLGELQPQIGKAVWPLVAQRYGTGETPVFEGKHVLMLGKPLEQIAQQHGTSVDELLQQMEPVRQKLLALRNQRERPLTDEKILAAWNGLMIRGMADVGRLLDEPKYVAAAEKAAEFVLAKLHQSDGRLLRTYTDNKASLNAYLDDYAFLANGLIALHKATDDHKWLDIADALTQKQIELFWDEENSGFYFTSHDHEQLIVRNKDLVDSAIPSGNSVTVENLLYLAKALDKPAYREKSTVAIRTALPLLARSPAAAPRLLTAGAELFDE